MLSGSPKRQYDSKISFNVGMKGVISSLTYRLRSSFRSGDLTLLSF